jgi:predicted GNAT family N-acyltransferase
MPVSDIYDEDGIPHIDMRRKCNEPHPMAREPVSP